MQINKLELKNIKYFESGSRETPCYNADVFINGKKAIHVYNDGNGGCDAQLMIKPFTYTELRDVYNYLNDQSPIDHEPLEEWCHDRLYEYLDQKKLKRDMKTKFICVDIDKNELYAYAKKGNTDTQFKAHMVKNHPQDTCLNFLSFNDAWKLFDEVTS